MSDDKPTGIIPTTDAGAITRIKSTPFISRDLADFGLPGVWVEVEPDEAEDMGAFEEIWRRCPAAAMSEESK